MSWIAWPARRLRRGTLSADRPATRTDVTASRRRPRRPRGSARSWQSLVALATLTWILGAGMVGRGQAQTAPPNRVLELDGGGARVALPVGIFDALEEATVETWMLWTDLAWGYQRVFEFGAHPPEGQRFMAITSTDGDSGDLMFEIWEPAGHIFVAPVANLVRAGEWCHLAVVTGRGGVRLYFNGQLVATHAVTFSFKDLGPATANLLGTHIAWSSGSSSSRMDEFRVWRVPRTAEEIRANLFRRLSGNEPGLVGLWNFDEVEGDLVKDAGPGGHDGRLIQGARTIEGQPPAAEPLRHPAIVEVTLTTENGQPLPDRAGVWIERNDVRVAAVSNGTDLWQHRESTTEGTPRVHRIALDTDGGEYHVVGQTRDLGNRVDLRLPPAETRRVDLAFRDAVDISGYTLAMDGSAQPAIRIELVRPPAAGLNPTNATVIRTAVSDQTGLFKFAALAPGPYQLRTRTPRGDLYHRDGEVIEFEAGRPVRFANLRFAPVKKGSLTAFTVADGLIGQQVRALAQGLDGSLWIGTPNGVSRFGGQEFVPFTSEDGLPAGTVRDILADRNGALWFGTDRGLARYRDGQFTPITARDGLFEGGVWGQRQAAEGHYWFAVPEGLVRSDGTNFTTIPLQAPARALRITSIAQDPKGTMWLGSDRGLLRLDGTNFVNATEAAGVRELPVIQVTADTEGAVWLGTRDRGLWRYDGNALQNWTVEDGLAHNTVRAIQLNADGQLWLGTGGGVSVLDHGRFLNFTEADGLPSSEVFAILRADDGAWWFGTENGLARHEPRTFTRYTTADGLPAHGVRSSFLDRDGTLWFSFNSDGATPPGIVRFSGGSFTNLTTTDGLAHGEVAGFAQTQDDAVWMGTGAGLSRFRNGAFTTLDQKNGFESRRAEALAAGPDGNLWIVASDQGLFRYDGVTFQAFPEPRLTGCRSVLAAADGAVWVGSATGLGRFQAGQFEIFGAAAGLPSTDISALLLDGGTNLWVGTAAGLTFYDGLSFRTNYTVGRGRLPNNQVNALFRDRDGVLWIGTDGGVARHDGATWSALNARDGLTSSRVTTINQTADGALWFGTDKGITRYEPPSASPPPPTVTVRLDEDYTDLKAIPPITAGRRVEFKLSAVDFKSRLESRRYSTLLIRGAFSPAEVDERTGWTPPSRDDRIDEVLDRPGVWTFATRYLDRDLLRSEPTVAVLKVVPPWYLDPRLMGPMLTVNLGLLAWAYAAGRMVVRRKREAERLREQLLEEEHRARAAAERARAEIEAGKLALQPQPVSVARLVDDIQRLFSINAGEKGLALGAEVDPRLPRGLLLDQVRLRQVLFNVVGNALKFTEKGHVRIRARAEDAATPANGNGDFTQFAPSTILVADDVALNRALVAGYLEGTAHTLVPAANGLEALEQAEKHRPDVILMDMRMPDLDGVEATRRLKANAALRHIPVIAVTASSFHEEEASARRVCDGFIRKPFYRAELISELRRFLKPAPAPSAPGTDATNAAGP